jgi:hypothetical protein
MFEKLGTKEAKLGKMLGVKDGSKLGVNDFLFVGSSDGGDQEKR